VAGHRDKIAYDDRNLGPAVVENGGLDIQIFEDPLAAPRAAVAGQGNPERRVDFHGSGADTNSELLVLKPGDKQYEEPAQIKVASSPTYAHPVVAGKRIFVKDHDAVTLWMFE
jgi:hypothetical protein